MSGEIIDHEARAIAGSAMQAIQSHEVHCGERWGESRKASEDLSNSVRRLHGRIDKIIWLAMLGAISIAANAIILYFSGAT